MFGREIFLLSVSTLADILPLPQIRDSHYSLFIVLDEIVNPAVSIGDLPDGLVRNGLAYVSVWGEDSERIHDIFDEAAVQWEIKSGSPCPLMSTWHVDESLDRALWFFINCTFPDERYAETCRSAFVVISDRTNVAKHIAESLEDIEGFNRRVLDEPE